MKSSNLIKTLKSLCALAIPMAGTQLITVGNIFLCMAILAKLGTETLAASALIFSVRLTLIVIGMSILFSLCVIIGRAWSEKNFLQVGNYVQHGWMLGLLISVPLILIFWHMEAILLFFKQSPKLAHIAGLFFRTNVWNVVPLMLGVCNQQLCYGVNKQRVDLIANILGVIILLMVSYPLILGRWGFASHGVRGLGIAFNLQAWFYFLFTTAVFYFDPHFRTLALFHFRIHRYWHDLLHMLKVGGPISVQMTGEILSLSAEAALIGWISVTALAAYQIVTQYFYLVIVPLFALSQATGILVSQALGEKKHASIKMIGNLGAAVGLLIAVVGAALFLLFPKALASLYTNVNLNTDLLHITVLLFAIFAVLQIFDGLRHIFIGALRGLFDTKIPMFVGIFSIWGIGLPLGYWLGFNLHWGALGVLIGVTIGIALGAIAMIYRWQILSLRHQSSLL